MTTHLDPSIDQLAVLHAAAFKAAETAFTEIHDRIELTCQCHPAWAPLFQEFAEALQINLGTALLTLVKAQTDMLIGSPLLTVQQKGA